MKYKFRFSPSIKSPRSTSQIMVELGLALCAVLGFSLFYYYSEYGMNHVIHILTLLVVSLVTAYVIEVIFAAVTKKDIKKHLTSSYPYITSLILVLISTPNVKIYPMIIGTLFAILFGKLIFGGFGQNIFNPAGVGRIVMMSGFGGQVIADLSTGATPVSTISVDKWTVAQGGFETFLEQFGGWQGLLTGWHPGAIGETPALLLIFLGIILVIRQVIDWRIPTFYIGTLAILGLLIAMVSGMDLSYAVFHVISGGALFGAVFMLTDPVTSPVHPVGRAIFGIGAALITVAIRLFGNTPGGVVYAIVLMNILVPLIDYLLAGNQIKTYKKAMLGLATTAIVTLLLGFLMGNVVEVAEAKTEENTAVILETKDEGDSKVYLVEAEGFHETNVISVKISSAGTIEEVKFDQFNDSKPEGEAATRAEFLDQFKGLDVNGEIDVDVHNSSTWSSTSVLDAVKKAVLEFGGQQ